MNLVVFFISDVHKLSKPIRVRDDPKIMGRAIPNKDTRAGQRRHEVRAKLHFFFSWSGFLLIWSRNHLHKLAGVDNQFHSGNKVFQNQGWELFKRQKRRDNQQH